VEKLAYAYTVTTGMYGRKKAFESSSNNVGIILKSLLEEKWCQAVN
jgi:hypothetical protein